MKKLLSQIVTAGIAAAILFLYAPGASAQDTVIVSVSGDLTGAVGTRGSWFTPILDYSKPTVSGEVRSRAALSGCANYAYIFSKRIATSFIVNVPNDSITWRLTVTIGAVVVFDQTYTNLDDSDFTKIVIPLGAMPAGEVEVVQRVEGYGNVTVARSAMYGESGTFNCLCAPAPVAGTLTADPPSGVPGTRVSVTGAMWDSGRTSAIYRLLFDGKLVAAQGDLVCYTQPNMTFDIPCDTPPGSHKIAVQAVEVFTQQLIVSRQIDFQVSPLSSLAGTICAQGAVSVEFEAREGNEPLTVNRNPTDGKEIGKRIFPDKDNPSDQRNKRIVKVIAKTSFAPDKTIYFKYFDVDDPTADRCPVDCKDETGTLTDDNRGKDVQLTSDLNGKKRAASAKTEAYSNPNEPNVKSIAVLYFTITMFPGDNFKIAKVDPFVKAPKAVF